MEFGSLAVTPWPIETRLPQDVAEVRAQFGPAIELYGYKRGDPRPGLLPLTLYWQASEKPGENYLVFVHLINASNGQIASQVDRLPLDGLRPTAGWRTGEVLTDEVFLPLPPDLPLGDYRINVGLYNPDSGERLPLTVDGQRIPNDQLTLETMVLP